MTIDSRLRARPQPRVDSEEKSELKINSNQTAASSVPMIANKRSVASNTMISKETRQTHP